MAKNDIPVSLNQDMKALICSDRIDSRFLARFLKWRSPTILS